MDEPQFPGACRFCSTPTSFVVHGGPCPRVAAIEYHQNGIVKRVEFRDEQAQVRGLPSPRRTR